jgi:CSLREA domain-containing protein
MKRSHGSWLKLWHANAPARAATLIVLALSLFGNLPARSYAAGPTLRVSAPSQVAVGEAIPISLTVAGATDLAGYETLVLFDTSAAEFAGLHQLDNDLKRMGRDVGSLTVAEMPAGSAIGLYSCPTASCVNASGPRQSHGASGDVQLATVDILPLQAGLLEIKLDATRFVDAAGQPLAVAMPVTTLRVQVGPAGAAHLAPARPWSLAPAGPGTAAAAAPGSLDLTDDGTVTHADVMEAALGWDSARERNQPCAQLANPRADVNHDGCLDIGDVQALAASSGPLPVVPSAQAAQTFTVNSTGDGPDADLLDGACATSSGSCTLRAAIQQANYHRGPDTIAFDIAGTGVHSIRLSQALPTLHDATGGTTIDGYTQPGASPNTDAAVSNAQIRIEIVGQGTYAFEAIRITSANNVLRGLSLYNLFRPIWLEGPGAHDNVMAGNFVGTDADGTFRSTGTITDATGILLYHAASHNRIGGTDPADRNVISGNARSGVGMWHQGTSYNVVMGNLVGYDPSGTRRVANTFHGIDMNSGSNHNIVGGLGPGERNVVCCSLRRGIEISHSGDTAFNQVIGNFVGTDVAGKTAPSWAYVTSFGIQVKDRVRNNVVAHNVVGNAREGGIRVDEYGTCCVGPNQIMYNRVGVSLDGTPIPNSVAGIYVTAGNTTIGPGNIIANNPIGIRLEGSTSRATVITQNSIYGNAGLGIDRAPIGTVNTSDKNFAVLKSADTKEARGTACAGCTVEVFVADGGAGKYGQGKTFVGSAVAAGDGTFVVPISGAAAGDYVTVTATSVTSSTSEFARNRLVEQAPEPPQPPAITGLDPNIVMAEGPAFTLTVTGQHFDSESVVRWNGAPRPTTFVSPTLLKASIAAADIKEAGSAAITVLNQDSNLESNALPITIKEQAPVPPPQLPTYIPLARR